MLTDILYEFALVFLLLQERQLEESKDIEGNPQSPDISPLTRMTLLMTFWRHKVISPLSILHTIHFFLEDTTHTEIT